MSKTETSILDREKPGDDRPREQITKVILVPDGGNEPPMFDVAAITAFVLRHWFALGLSAFIGAALAVAISYAFPKVYRAEVLLTPADSADEGGGLEGLISKYGGLASAVGLGLPSMKGGDSAAALARLQSRTFLEDFISDQNLMGVLFPGDEVEVRGTTPAVKPKRTLQDGYRKFSRRIMLVKQDKVTDLVTIRIDWKDRQLAADWANALVARLNQVMRTTAIQETERSLQYLKQELQKAEYVTLKDSISKLMETQVNKRMLAVTQPDYAFRVIDPAKPSDANKKVSPMRIVFAVVGMTLGIFAGVLWCLRRQRLAR